MNRTILLSAFVVASVAGCTEQPKNRCKVAPGLAVAKYTMKGSPSGGSCTNVTMPLTELVGISGGSAFDALAENIADTASRSMPVVAASAGFTYRYNTELEIFERASGTLGPIFLERPDMDAAELVLPQKPRTEPRTSR